VRLGLLLQFTAIGAPAIYYGDEIGMDGGGIPDNRRPMRFERTPDEQALFEYARALIALRKGSVALRRGEWTTVLVDDARGLYGFVRHHAGDAALVLLNLSDQSQRATVPAWDGVPQWAHAVSTYTPTQTTYTAVQGRITVDLPPLSGTALVPSSNSPIGGKLQ
jgi:glycosidase